MLEKDYHHVGKICNNADNAGAQWISTLDALSKIKETGRVLIPLQPIVMRNFPNN